MTQSSTPTAGGGHTAGDWRVEGRRGAGYIISAGINAEGDGPLTYVGVLDPMFHIAGERVAEHAANAHLIAAAPAIYAALEAVHLSAARIPGTPEFVIHESVLAGLLIAMASAEVPHAAQAKASSHTKRGENG